MKNWKGIALAMAAIAPLALAAGRYHGGTLTADRSAPANSSAKEKPPKDAGTGGSGSMTDPDQSNMNDSTNDPQMTRKPDAGTPPP